MTTTKNLFLFIVFILVVSFISLPVNYTFAQEENESTGCFLNSVLSSLESMKVPLRYGMQNKHVGILQQALVCLDYLDSKNITNFYGENTTKAIRKLLVDGGLAGTGRVFSKEAKEFLILKIKDLIESMKNTLPPSYIKIISPVSDQILDIKICI